MADEDKATEGKEEPAAVPEDAIRQAVAAAVSDLQAEHAAEIERIKANRAEILTEKQTEAEKRRELAAELEKVKLKATAADKGHDPEEFATAVERQVAEQRAVLEQEWSALDGSQKGRITELESELQNAKSAAHEAGVAAAIVDAALGDRRIWHEGAGPDVVEKLAPFMHRKEVDGAMVWRFKTAAGTNVPSVKHPGQLMGPEEFLGLARAGKRVEGLPAISWYLVDKAQAADVKEVGSKTAGRTWSQMSEAEKMAAHESDPAEAARLIAEDAVKMAQKALHVAA